MKDELAGFIRRQAEVALKECIGQGGHRTSLQWLYGELWQLDSLCRMLGLPALAELLEEA